MARRHLRRRLPRFAYKKSRRGNAAIDRAAMHVSKHSGHPFSVQEFLPYGYDERQYCSQGFDLPVGCLMRSPHGSFPEYHTSTDDLALVRPQYLEESFNMYPSIVELLECNITYFGNALGTEPGRWQAFIARHRRALGHGLRVAAFCVGLARAGLFVDTATTPP
jgi:aminopeptidase-like protein